ncbi:hypothetical protein BU25DRAFT_98406 [Macroventuria anomochaeta]|uniref:Uncharacterized protein n=1 Tax=Macroventuria anomochaeta TaxID=301207 RepID=A0ACB6RZR7_9PLEO|nr:uncharacterized protein BU25DRAFT_98406 [Macroventuria anomochaeta]KAF2626439.1 hypothetical protein BU25DRAFT_98406 [Macroventuria anomochaeta]
MDDMNVRVGRLAHRCFVWLLHIGAEGVGGSCFVCFPSVPVILFVPFTPSTPSRKVVLTVGRPSCWWRKNFIIPFCRLDLALILASSNHIAHAVLFSKLFPMLHCPSHLLLCCFAGTFSSYGYRPQIQQMTWA